MSGSQPSQANANEAWRNFTTRTPILACKINGADDLKRLYKIINQKQFEHWERVKSRLFKMDRETSEQFEERWGKNRDAFITTITVTGVDGKVVTGHGEDFFASELMPENVVSIAYDTSFSPAALLKYTPTDRVYLFLDFTKPPLVNFGVQPDAPTPNSSHFFISAETEAWQTSLQSNINLFFKDRATSVEWLHKSSVYTLLLLILGGPAALWLTYRFGKCFLIGKNIDQGLLSIAYVYVFFLILNAYRLLFSYSRWAFPKIELETQRSNEARHRAILGVIMLSILASAIWDTLKYVTG